MSAIDFPVACPAPLGRHTTIQLAHGGGGQLTRELIEGIFLPAFDTGRLDSQLRARHDSAVVTFAGTMAFTTDSYVVKPRFFPGGDIGKLAVFGTVNDLAMSGARPLYMSVGFILEEGLEIDELRRVAASMRYAADHAGIEIVTGDTKVVDRGKGDGIFINTSGVGLVKGGLEIGPRRIQVDDAIILSGDIGRHGVAILSVRNGLSFETPVESDCAPLASQVQALLDAGVEVHCLRDTTRGGLATVLNELARDAGVSIAVDERAIPVSEGVKGACELFGLDPLYVACEGRFVAFVPQSDAARAVETLRGLAPPGDSMSATCMGVVRTEPKGVVVLKTQMGSHRLLDLLSGEQLPRIC